MNAAVTSSSNAGRLFSPKTHSVHIIERTEKVKKSAYCKSESRTYIGRASAITIDDDFVLASNVFQVDFIVLANNTPQSLLNNCVGGSFYSSTSQEIFSSIVEAAVGVLTVDTQKTLHSMSKNTFTGTPPPFIAKVLLAKEFNSRPTTPSDILDDKMFGFVKLFIASLAKECISSEVKDLKNAKVLLEKRMNSTTVEGWLAFRSSLAQQLLPSSSMETLPLPPMPPSNEVWAFLDNRDCPVSQVIDRNIHCVEMKNFTKYSIRNVVLELQVAYSTFEIGSRFRVNRFSNEVGTVEDGKYLNGAFEGSDTLIRISHKYFVVQDEESPEH